MCTAEYSVKALNFTFGRAAPISDFTDTLSNKYS